MITAEVINVVPELPWNLQFAALVLSTIAQFYFWSLYSAVKWKRHFVGRALFGQASALLFVFIVIDVTRFFTFPGEEWVRAGAYFTLTAALTNQAYAMWKQQHFEGEYESKGDVDDAPKA